MSCRDQCLVMDHDGYNEFYREATRRARKAYRCCECNDVIAVGDSHQYVTGKSEGSFWENRTCAVCVEIRDTYKCDTWLFGVLWEMVNEQMFPGWNEMTAIDCLARLTTTAAVDKMRAEYAEYLEEANAGAGTLSRS